ncbi:Aste57867_20053 [Aphanomyces stellatus]|uniref:Aste57867_20053 protein n=1 Tax=Aphanomyces stellatus TaxID=120398 RepID=A0A485LIR0_9STRA|nr:hypothetical protein As57867_019987 [Aphanomyces stellatus]VFT96749.1 Aste57867_20053 [Aphanomyces stellatus]
MEAAGDAKAKAGGGRLSKRRNERIRTFYKINNNQLTRSELTEEDIAGYVQHIDSKCLAKFGVMKLSKYNLNVCCAVADDVKLSLLQYAAIHAPHVCLSLFYAGADPSYDCSEDDVMFPDARALVLRYPVHYIVWINLLLASARPRDGLDCIHCHDGPSSLVLSPCNHPICLVCFWAHFASLRIDHDMSCPHCNAEVVNPAAKCPPRPPPTTDSPTEIADKSFQAYTSLSTIPPKGHKNVKPVIEALPLWRALQLYVGLTPKQRDTEMFKAVAADNAARIKALVQVGVNVNCRNEYGQTPLFVAAWMGYGLVVDALLASGAATDLADNAHTVPAQCAAANGHMDIASRLGGTLDVDDMRMPAVAAPPAVFVELIPSDSTHPGAGSGIFDNVFPDDFLARLDALHKNLPVAPKEKESCSDRSYFCDSVGWVIQGIRNATGRAVFPNMRFLHYHDVGGSLPPHVDLSRTDLHGVTSTKTFIIYLTTCASGGETNLLTSIVPNNEIIAGVKPVRGRLLVFPHACPHEGAVVEHVPKLLLRGEMY